MSRAVLFLAVLLTSATAFANEEEPAYPAPLSPAPSPQTPYYPAQVPYTPGPTYVEPPPHAPPHYTYPAPVEGPKHTSTAAMLSIGATIAPPLLAWGAYGDGHDDVLLKVTLASVMIGPSVGHVYAGKFLTPGVAVRTLGFAVAMSASGANDLSDALGRIMIGSIGIVTGAIADLATVGKSVRESNAEHMRVVPTVTPVVDQHGNTRVQVGMSGSF